MSLDCFAPSSAVLYWNVILYLDLGNIVIHSQFKLQYGNMYMRLKGCDLTYQLKLTSNKLLKSIQTEKHLLWMSSGSIQSITSPAPPASCMEYWNIKSFQNVLLVFQILGISKLQLQKSCKDLRYLSAKTLNRLRISCPASALNWIEFFNLELVVVSSL